MEEKHRANNDDIDNIQEGSEVLSVSISDGGSGYESDISPDKGGISGSQEQKVVKKNYLERKDRKYYEIT